jgi:hypothetical protein
MNPDKVISYIDKVVIEQIQQGLRWNDISKTLKEKVTNYKKRDSYIQVSERYLINNWDRIEWKKRMTTMLVIQSLKRLSDIKWIKENHSKFPQLGSVGIYKLIELKDKLRYNQSQESISDSTSGSTSESSSNS